jgi:hypothetical protein
LARRSTFLDRALDNLLSGAGPSPFGDRSMSPSGTLLPRANAAAFPQQAKADFASSSQHVRERQRIAEPEAEIEGLQRQALALGAEPSTDVPPSRGDARTMKEVCPKTEFPVTLGCALRYTKGGEDYSCHVFIAEDDILKPTGWNYNLVLRHELGHCLGWPANHPGMRTVEEGGPMRAALKRQPAGHPQGIPCITPFKAAAPRI